ncbi:hypothetical protein [Saccharopolyspora aridisoli]|uniref:hypothetical protein n=1 Tax=Saccharopolyspora aridisoli TaxID=2530385 RepID=UPI0014045B4C|nr:hypothetical protein [Saccharopolyspora aridisoli]
MNQLAAEVDRIVGIEVLTHDMDESGVSHMAEWPPRPRENSRTASQTETPVQFARLFSR